MLSGGEKSRVALARTLLVPANFLILDEPTNHLDIQSINVLIEALRQYSGTFVVVSHDRHFLDRIINKVWRVENGTVRPYLGNFTEYRWQVEHGTASRLAETKTEDAKTNGRAKAASETARGPKTKEQKRREAEERRRRYEESRRAGQTDFSLLNDFQLKRVHDETEAAIFEKEEEKARLEAAVADPSLYADPARAQATTEALAAVEETLAALYRTWEAIAEEMAAREEVSG